MQKLTEKHKKEESNIPVHVVAVFVFVKKGNKLLLTKRSSDDPQSGGEWSVPGGKVDMDEGFEIVEKTVQREVVEETGIQIKPNLTYLGSGGFYRVSGHHVVKLEFLAEWEKGVAQPLEDQDEVKWVTVDELKEISDLPKYITQRIPQLINFLNDPETSSG